MFKINKEYMTRKINNSYFLISRGKCLNKKWVYELNETGAKIWELCAEISDVDELIVRLSKIYKDRKFETFEKNAICSYVLCLEKEGLIWRDEEYGGERITNNNK